jgi:hypothetical protein
MLFHAQTGEGDATFRTDVLNVILAMSGMCWNGTTFDSAEFAAAGSNIFSLDPGWSVVTRTSSTNPAATDAPSHFVQFGGRSPSTGKRVKYYLFEDATRDTADMRFSIAENADVAAVVDAIEAGAATIGAIDGTPITVYQYANVGQNDFLTHKARRS